MFKEIVLGSAVADYDFYPFAAKHGHSTVCFHSELTTDRHNVRITPVKGLITKAEFSRVVRMFYNALSGYGPA